MNTLVSAFLIQLLLCAILFVLIFYFAVRNAELKKEIEPRSENLKNPVRD